MKRAAPLWEVFVDVRARTVRPSRYVEAASAMQAMRKVRHARSARLIGDGVNRRLFPELFE